MTNFDSLIHLGFSPTMLFPQSFEDPLAHFAAIEICCHYPHYEAFDTWLPDDKSFRDACIRKMKACGKKMNYNSPGTLQLEGAYYPCSDDPAVRAQALNYARTHVDYAAEIEAPFFVATGCLDKGEERRPELMKRFTEFFLQLAEHCQRYHMDILIEPIERHRFKKLILGPTKECAAFIADAQKNGAHNAHLMLDVAHLPLMEENIDEAIAASLPVGLHHVHLGNAVLEPGNSFYGHTHPPMDIHGGTFDYTDLKEQFVKLFECGFIPRNAGGKRATISLEVRPYPGCGEKTSIQLMYEKTKSACDEAAAQLGIY